MNIIPCLTWVKRGVSKTRPDRIQLDKDELKRIIEETKEEIDDVDDILDDELSTDDEDDNEKKNIKGATGGKSTDNKKFDRGKKRKKQREEEEEEDDEDIVSKYGLNNYEDEIDNSNPLKGIGNLMYYTSNDDDPYITLKDEVNSDDEEFEIKPTDNLVVVGKAEKDACILDVYIYNEDYSNLYVHHDILLGSFPLCVEWLNYDVAEQEPGSFVAVGTMDPIIEIWDLDVVDSLEPVAILGSKVSKKKKKKKGVIGHTDAVLDLSWNSNVRNVLASASADFTVGLWDLSEGKIVTSITQHQEKVQCVKWHPLEAQSLLTGSFDNTVKVYDCRNPNESYKSWNLEGEIERVLWDIHSPLNFFASTEKGRVYYLDSRKDKPVFTLSAHSKAVTGISQSCTVPGLMTTVSADHMFKVWDIENNKPSLVLEKNLRMNELHCLGNCPEAPFVFAIGGGKELKVWDIRESAAVRKHFSSKTPAGVTMEGDGDIAEDTAASALETLNLERDSDNDSLFGESAETTQPVKKKKKKKKKSKQPKN